MKWKNSILPAVLLLFVGYSLGVLLPPWFLNLTRIANGPINRGDYLLIVVGAFTALGTFSAAVVALFMNEIRGLFKKVSYNIRLDSPEAIEDVVDIKGSKKAKRYHNSVQFHNEGNINALNCELYVENAELTENGITTPLNWENAPIKWGAEYIPYQGKRILPIFEITAPQKQSTPDGKINELPGQINIAGLKAVEARAGSWSIDYCLYSASAKPKKFRLLINWNGKWEERQKEMKEMLKMSLTMI